MANTVRVNADHMTKVRNFTKGQNRDFSAFRLSLLLNARTSIKQFNSLSDEFTKITYKS